MNNCQKINKNCNKGFTLLELMIVIAIIVVLAATSIVIFNPAEKQREQRDVLRVSNLSQISSLLELFYAEKKYYPAEIGDLTSPSLGLKGVRVSFEDPNFECEIKYEAESSLSPGWYKLYAVKESQNFTIPKGQDLISELPLPSDMTFSGECPVSTNVFMITGGNPPSN